MATAPKPPEPASAKPAEAVSKQQTTPQPTRTLLDTLANAVAEGKRRQKQAKALTPADADAHGRHDAVRRNIRDVFQESCSDAVEKLAASPLRKKYPVFEVELRDLRNELGTVLREACEAYTNLAISHRSEIGSDPLGWVQDHVNADLSGMHDRLEQWVHEAVGLGASLDLPAWIDYHELRRALGRRPSDIELAEALPDATGALMTIWTHFRTALETTKGAMIQAAREKLAAVPTSNPSAPGKHRTTGKQISAFDSVVGKLMVEARKGTSTRNLPESVVDGILDAIDSDSHGFTPGKNLEGKKRKELNKYNKEHPRAALKTFKDAAKNPVFHEAVRDRLCRAADNYKKHLATCPNMSAGKSRTTF